MPWAESLSACQLHELWPPGLAGGKCFLDGVLSSVLLGPHALRKGGALADAPNKLERLIDDDHGEGEGKHNDPVIKGERDNGEDGCEHGHVHDDEMQAERNQHRYQEPRVHPWRDLQQ
eukprot:scaffold3572_cov125-Isochrysis_galbana.AAC.12